MADGAQLAGTPSQPSQVGACFIRGGGGVAACYLRGRFLLASGPVAVWSFPPSLPELEL